MGHIETLDYAQTGVATTGADCAEKIAVWKPDVEMPIPFAPHHLFMASLYIRGYSIPDIAGIIDRSPKYCVKLFNDVCNFQSMPYKIREATGFTPKSTIQTILWMSKHKFLEPIPEVPKVLINGKSPFNQTYLHIMREFMGGNTSHPKIAKKVLVSEGSLRNYFSTHASSIRSIISRCCEDNWWAPNTLSAGYWMVSHGYLPASIIGEQLP